MSAYKPRVNASMLGGHLGQEVVVIGRVDGSDGASIKLLTSDGNHILVESDGIVDESAPFVEVCGIAVKNGVRAKSSVNLDATFDLQKYEEALQLIQHFPAPFHA